MAHLCQQAESRATQHREAGACWQGVKSRAGETNTTERNKTQGRGGKAGQDKEKGRINFQ